MWPYNRSISVYTKTCPFEVQPHAAISRGLGGAERGTQMKPALKLILPVIMLMGVRVLAAGQAQNPSGRMKVMKEELTRNFEALQKESAPPYYMSYSIEDVRS